jgi:hypothetical protein
MDIAQQIEQIEVSIEEAKKTIALGDKFEKLRHIPEFQEIIEEGYFQDESKRLVLLLADANMQDEGSQKMLKDGIIGIGQLFQYFRTIKGLASQAKNALAADEETHADLLTEGDA